MAHLFCDFYNAMNTFSSRLRRFTQGVLFAGVSALLIAAQAEAQTVKPVMNPLNFPSEIMVSQPVNLSVSASNAPTKFTITGLVSGLGYDPVTGTITGRAAVPGAFIVNVSASNTAGPGAVVQAEINVLPLPPEVPGIYDGCVSRQSVLGNNLGGKLHLVLSNTGQFTGTLNLGIETLPLRGALMTDALGPIDTDLIIARSAPASALRLRMRLLLSGRSLTGSVEDGTAAAGGFVPGVNSASISAAQTTHSPWIYTGNYTLAASHEITGEDKPQGYTLASFKINSSAAVSGAFKLADGTPVTFAGNVGQDGSSPVFALLYAKTGSLHGKVSIDTTQRNRLNASTLTWNKSVQTAATRYFKNGFSPLTLSVIGRPYNSPAVGGMAMGLPSGLGNAQLIFTQGLAPSPTTRLDVNPLTIGVTPTSVIKLPASVSAAPTPGSHAQITLGLVPGSGSAFTIGSTGFMSGKIVLKDYNPASPATIITRTNACQALIVDDGSSKKGYGYFLLEELPDATLTPTPTPTTTPYRSGKVVLSAATPPPAPTFTVNATQNEFDIHIDDTYLASSYTLYISESPNVSPENYLRKVTGVTRRDIFLNGLPPGVSYYMILVANNDRGSAASAPIVKTFGPNATITGRIVVQMPDVDKVPFVTGVPGRLVSLGLGPKGRVQQTQTDADGRFTFRQVPFGRCSISVAADAEWSGTQFNPFDLTAYGRSIGNIPITALAGRTAVTGRVYFKDGTPAFAKIPEFDIDEAAAVTLQSAGLPGKTVMVARDGHYLFSVLNSAFPIMLNAALKGASGSLPVSLPMGTSHDLIFAATPPNIGSLTFTDAVLRPIFSIHCLEIFNLVPELLDNNRLAATARWQITTPDGQVLARADGAAPSFQIKDNIPSGTLHIHGICTSDLTVTTQVITQVRYNCGQKRCWSGAVLEWSATTPASLVPVAGATVKVTASNITGTATVTTDAQGRFDFPKGAEPINPLVQITKAGYVPYAWKFNKLPEEAEIPLIKTTTITATWPASGADIPLPDNYFLRNNGSSWTKKGLIPYTGQIKIEFGSYDPLATWQPFPPQPKMDAASTTVFPRLASGVWMLVTGTAGEIINPTGGPAPSIVWTPTSAATATGAPLAGIPAAVPIARLIDTLGLYSNAGNTTSILGAYIIPWENATLLSLYAAAAQTQVLLTADRTLNFPFQVLVNNSSFPITVYNSSGDTTNGPLSLPSSTPARFRVLNLRQAPGVYSSTYPAFTPIMSYAKQVIVDVTKPAAGMPLSVGVIQNLSLSQNIVELQMPPRLTSIGSKLANPSAFLDVYGIYSDPTASSPFTHIADEYYAAINAPLTFSAWKTKNHFPQNVLTGTPPAPITDPWVTAFYYNLGDLGFARRQSMRTFIGVDGQTNVAMAVTNFRSIEDAHCDRNPIATVCMEYSPRSYLDSVDVTDAVSVMKSLYQRYVQFTVYSGNTETLVKQASLDGSTPKPVPNLCVTCHGGNRFEPGGSPNLGSVFIPFDAESFTYHRAFGTQPVAFAALNKGVLQTQANPTVVNLIHGWYGATDPTTATGTFNANYIPTYAPGGFTAWSAGGATAAAEYNGIFKTSCRVCHNSRLPGYTLIDTWDAWQSLRGPQPSYAPCNLYMPAAQRTWGIFWGSRAGEVIVPGSGYLPDLPSQIFGPYPWPLGCPDPN